VGAFLCLVGLNIPADASLVGAVGWMRAFAEYLADKIAGA
jgi:hypothetical protein